MSTVKNYLSLIKFSHTVFAMPFALIGFFLGWRQRTIDWEILMSNFVPAEWSGYRDEVLTQLWWKLLLVILCMVFARSAAMAFNRYLDREYDSKNPRTATREIPAGVISARHALVFTIISCVAFMITCYFINRVCFYLSPVALAVVLGYSYTKRFTALCHLVLGLGLSLAPIGAYLAIAGDPLIGTIPGFHFNIQHGFPWIPVLFSITVLFWVSGFDIIYALQDEEFDRSQQLYSIPAMIGKHNALMVSRVLHVLSFTAVVIAGWYSDAGWLYWIGVAVFGGMLLYQHSLVRPDDLRKINLAFMTANGIASVVFAMFVIADIYVRYS